MPSSKDELRRKMRALLAAVTPQQHAAWSQRIVAGLTAEDGWLGASGVVALFGGLQTEPDLLALMPWLQARGVRVAFFAIGSDGAMHPHPVRDASDLIPGPFGVLEPDVAKCPRVEDSAIKIVLLPGLAFSVGDGARLGRGKGYYDRFLTRLPPDARIIGIGFSVQMLVGVPHEPHDILVQWMVSEDGWRAVPRSS